MNIFARTAVRTRHAVLVACLIFSGCASAPAERSLYERLGGVPALTAVTDKTIDRASTDPQTRRTFQGVNLKTLKASLVAHLCHVTGGPCKYEGAPMAKAHGGLNITSAEFDAMVGQLVATLDEFKVPAREKNELLGILGPMKSDVVGK